MTLFHPSPGTLADYDSGVLSPRRTGRLSDHLASCPRCRRTLQWERSIRARLRDASSPPAPEGAFDAVQARLAAEENLLLPAGPLTDRGPRPAGRRVAAGFALALAVAAGSAAAAVAGGGWEVVRGWLPDGRGAAPPVGAAPASGVDVEVPRSGLRIVLEGAAPHAVLRITVADQPGSPLSLTGHDEAATVRFLVGGGGVRVRGLSGGRLDVEVPTEASGPVRIVSDERLVGWVQDGRIQLRGLAPGDGGPIALAALTSAGDGPAGPQDPAR